jgi:hypothetical protein
MEPSTVAADLLGQGGKHFAELRKHTYVRKAVIDPAEVLVWAELERLINETGVKRTLFQDGTRTDSPTAIDIMQEVRGGATLQLQHVENYCPRIANILGELSVALAGETMNSNIYLAPSKEHHAFPIHHDTVDTIVLQISGCKRWKVWKQIICDPIWIMRKHDYQVNLEDAAIDIILEPGDILYLKRGDPHQVQCVGDQASLHVNLRIEPTTGSDVFEWIVQEALEEPANRSSMPVGGNITFQDQLTWFSHRLRSLSEYCGDIDNGILMEKFLTDRVAASGQSKSVFMGAMLPNLICVTPNTRFSLSSPMLRTVVSERGIVVHGQLLEMPKHLLRIVSHVFRQPSARWTVKQLAHEFSTSEDEICDLVRALAMHNVFRLYDEVD